MRSCSRQWLFLAVLVANSLSAQATWSLVATTGTLPVPRNGPALTYDSTCGRVVLFGGATTGVMFSTYLGDTWEFDGVAWQPVGSTAAPVPREHPALAYDSARRRVVLFGGDAGLSGISYGDTWVLAAGQWSDISSPTGPAERTEHALAYDSVRDRVVLFGGWQGGLAPPQNDTWELGPAGWTQIATAVAPSARFGHGLAFDSVRGRTVLFGGGTPATNFGDTWQYDGINWTLQPTVHTPGPRTLHAMAFDAAHGRVLLSCGSVFPSGAPLGDAWQYDGVDWGALATTGAPAARYSEGLAFDGLRDRAVMFGGRNNTNFYLNDTWELLPQPAAGWTRHGLGCPGSGGTPSLDRVGAALPTLGSSFPLQLTSLPPAPGFYYLALGFGITQWAGVALPVDFGSVGMPGCKWWIEPAPGSGTLLAHPGGSASWSLTIPAVPAFAGLHVAVQTLVLDAASGNGIGALSNAGVATLF
jgi:hypothetical protein